MLSPQPSGMDATTNSISDQPVIEEPIRNSQSTASIVLESTGHDTSSDLSSLSDSVGGTMSSIGTSPFLDYEARLVELIRSMPACQRYLDWLLSHLDGAHSRDLAPTHMLQVSIRSANYEPSALNLQLIGAHLMSLGLDPKLIGVMISGGPQFTTAYVESRVGSGNVGADDFEDDERIIESIQDNLSEAIRWVNVWKQANNTTQLPYLYDWMGFMLDDGYLGLYEHCSDLLCTGARDFFTNNPQAAKYVRDTYGVDRLETLLDSSSDTTYLESMQRFYEWYQLYVAAMTNKNGKYKPSQKKFGGASGEVSGRDMFESLMATMKPQMDASEPQVTNLEKFWKRFTYLFREVVLIQIALKRIIQSPHREVHYCGSKTSVCSVAAQSFALTEHTSSNVAYMARRVKWTSHTVSRRAVPEVKRDATSELIPMDDGLAWAYFSKREYLKALKASGVKGLADTEFEVMNQCANKGINISLFANPIQYAILKIMMHDGCLVRRSCSVG